jgi:hypothetical protein
MSGCGWASSSTGGAGQNTPDIVYKAEIPEHQRLVGRVMQVVETSEYSEYYKALISEIIITQRTRTENKYWAMIRGSRVWLSYDAVLGRSYEQINMLLSHEAEHRSKGLVDGDSDYRHLTEWSCTRDLYGTAKNKCTFPEALRMLM